MSVKNKIKSEDKLDGKEVKFFKYINHLIRRMKNLEQDKHNPPLFTTATTKL